MALYVCLMCCLMVLVSGLPDYQARMPNGYKVAHPCFANFIWKGVGHQFHGGGGMLNPFGEDFRANNFKWDSCICNEDSDGDGMTNGEELGDPRCVWTEGDLPEITDGITHPGVCEPVDSQDCHNKNDFNVCAPIDFECPGKDDEVIKVLLIDPDYTSTTQALQFLGPYSQKGISVSISETEPIDLVFSQTQIPKQETTYYCMAVEFDATRDVHAFAMEPILNNSELVHHIDMYECMDEEYWDDILREFKYPRQCGAMSGCAGNMLAAWAVGINGICLNDDVGIRVGKYGAKVAFMRIHYHNPSLREGETDASGLKFYTTPVIRTHDAQVMNLGQMYLEIPPGQVEHIEPVTCSHLCTNSWSEDIYVIFGAMHMHYLGTGGYSEELDQDGNKVKDIMVQDFYDYNAPHMENFYPPIQIKRGNTIRHHCRFHSRDRTDVTWRGQAATDEMCHIYFVYYPAQNLTECFNDATIETCRFRTGDRTDHCNELCDCGDFDKVWNNYMKNYLLSKCDESGQECPAECPAALEWAYNNHTCLSGEARRGMFKRKGELARMQSGCADYPPIVDVPSSTLRPEGECVFGKASVNHVSALMVCVMSVLGLLVNT